jgi:hypothetical protein
VTIERSELTIRSGFARVVCGLSPLRRGIISSLPVRGRGGVSQGMRCAAAAGWLCKASRGPRSGWEGWAFNSLLVTAAALNADGAGVSLH